MLDNPLLKAIWAKKSLLLWLAILFLVIFFGYKLNQKTVAVIPNTQGLDTKQAQALAQILADKQLHFFTGNLGEVAESVKQLSWVSSVAVARDWHKGVVVSVVPRQAVARFGSAHLVDAQGVVFVPADPAALSNDKLANLYGDVRKTKVLMQKLHQANLWFAPTGLWVKDVSATPRDTWVVRFGSGLRVIVDFEHLDEKLFGLSRILDSKQLSVDALEVVDLRYKNGFSIVVKPKAASMGAAKLP